MKITKILFGLVLLVLISLTSVSVFAGSAAYINRNPIRYDQNLVDTLVSRGFTVNTVAYAYVDSVDFSDYDLILVGDEPFLDPSTSAARL